MLLKTSFTYKPIAKGCTFLSGFAFKSEEFSDVGIPVVKIKNIQNKNVDFSDSQFLPNALYNNKLDKFKVYHKDVLIAMTGQGSVGRVGQVRIDENKFGLLNQRVGKFICDEELLNRDYLYYILTSDRYQEHLFDKAVGSGQPNLSPSDIVSTEIPFPNYSEQIAIASILSALDDKIELNLQQNKTLEEMAMAIYKHWFVDFGPFQNGEFVESELGLIPSGWEVKKFGDLIDKIIDNRGKTPPLSEVKTEYLLFETYQLTRERLFPDVFQENKAKYVTKDIYNNPKWFRKGHPEFMDILFATVGNGIPNWSFMYENNGVGIAQNVVALRPKANISSAFLRYSFESKSFLEQFDGYVITTAQPSIKLSDLNMIDMLKPNDSVLTDWLHNVDPLIKQVYSNYLENQTLTTLRDTLLPKLISGEVRVKEAQQILSSVL